MGDIDTRIVLWGQGIACAFHTLYDENFFLNLYIQSSQ